MSIQQIRKAVSKSLLGEDAWPPSLPEFVARGDLIEVDYDEAFTRMIRNKTIGDAEYWANREVGYACRNQLDEGRARAKHRKALKKYLEKAQLGSLPTRNLVQIEHKPSLVPSMNERPESSQFAKGSVFARIAAMGRKA